MAGVYRFHSGGGAICSGVGWACGRLPAGSGCRGRTVGGYSAASPWCVPWWPLVGWLKGVFGVYRIHGGTIVCWGAAAVGAAGCGGGACVGVDRVFGGGVSCVVLSGSSWWSVVVVPGGWSWALRFLGGCGTCGVGLAGGGGRGCVGLRVCPLLPPWPLPLPVPYSSLFAGLFGFVFFFFFGGGGWGVVRGCGCVPVSAPGSQGAGSGGADGGWLAAVVAWRLRGWLRLLVSVWVAWPGVGVRVGVFVAWADGVVGSVGLVGLCGCRVCVRRRRSGLGWGTVGDAMGGGDAGDPWRGMTYRGGSYLFGQYGVCALCCVACPFGGSIAPSQTRQWTSYCASPFSILPTINCKSNLREGKLLWRSRSDALGARCVFCNFPYFHVPTWEVALVTFQSAPSGAHTWNRRSLVSSHYV